MIFIILLLFKIALKVELSTTSFGLEINSNLILIVLSLFDTSFDIAVFFLFAYVICIANSFEIQFKNIVSDFSTAHFVDMLFFGCLLFSLSFDIVELQNEAKEFSYNNSNINSVISNIGLLILPFKFLLILLDKKYHNKQTILAILILILFSYSLKFISL